MDLAVRGMQQQVRPPLQGRARVQHLCHVKMSTLEGPTGRPWPAATDCTYLHGNSSLEHSPEALRAGCSPVSVVAGEAVYCAICPSDAHSLVCRCPIQMLCLQGLQQQWTRLQHCGIVACKLKRRTGAFGTRHRCCTAWPVVEWILGCDQTGNVQAAQTVCSRTGSIVRLDVPAMRT